MQKDLSIKEISEILSTFTKGKDSLIKALHLLQEKHPQNYISQETLEQCCSYFSLTKAEVYGVVSYYSMFSLKPRGKYHISICKSPVCTIMGTDSLVEYLKSEHMLTPGNTSDDGIFSLERVECLGRCGKAPSMMINKEFYMELTNEKIDQILENLKNN